MKEWILMLMIQSAEQLPALKVLEGFSSHERCVNAAAAMARRAGEMMKGPSSEKAPKEGPRVAFSCLEVTK